MEKKIPLQIFKSICDKNNLEYFTADEISNYYKNGIEKSAGMTASEKEEFVGDIISLRKCICIDDDGKDVTMYFKESDVFFDEFEKARAGVYADTSKNRRLHRVGQKYGAEGKPDEEGGEKRSKNEVRTERLKKYQESLKKIQEKLNDKGLSDEARKMGEELKAKMESKIEKLSKKIKPSKTEEKAEEKPEKEPQEEVKKKIAEVGEKVEAKSLLSPEEKEEINRMSFRALKETIKDLDSKDEYNPFSRLRVAESSLKSAERIPLDGTHGEIVDGKYVQVPNTEEYRSKKISEAKGVLDKTKEELSFLKARFKEVKKAREEFLNKTGNSFTPEEVQEYLMKYNDKPVAARVYNSWKYYMGKYGNTHASISLGENGKEKPLERDRWSLPSWRPIGWLSYTVDAGWGLHSKYETIEVPIQSWDDVFEHLSDTENQYLTLYKHPKQ